MLWSRERESTKLLVSTVDVGRGASVGGGTQDMADTAAVRSEDLPATQRPSGGRLRHGRVFCAQCITCPQVKTSCRLLCTYTVHQTLPEHILTIFLDSTKGKAAGDFRDVQLYVTLTLFIGLVTIRSCRN